MKSKLIFIEDEGKRYSALLFICPGCQTMENGGSGLHLLPVKSFSLVFNPKDKDRPYWDWDGNLDRPTLHPSILTGKGTPNICHSFLRLGIFEYLNDSTHIFAGKKIPMIDLPEWVI